MNTKARSNMRIPRSSFRTSGRRFIAILSVVVFSCGLMQFFACGRSAEPVEDNRPELLILGIDGLDWEIINPLIEKGAMPNIAALIDKGVKAPLRSIRPLWSPQIWTSIATGKIPKKHGIYGFSRKTDDSQRAHYSGDRKVKALWNILSEYDVSVGQIAWWVSWPAEKVLGFNISSKGFPLVGDRKKWESRPREKHRFFPAELETELDESVVFNKELDREILADYKVTAEKDWYYARDISYVRMAEKIYPRFKTQVLMIYLDATDPVSHYYMPGDWEKIDLCYEFMDTLVGRLLNLMPSDTNVVVCSDHGFGNVSEEKQNDRAQKSKFHLPAPKKKRTPESGKKTKDRADAGKYWHQEIGVFIAAGPAFVSGVEAGEISVLDVLPIVMTALGLPVAQDLDGRVPTEVFRGEFLEKNAIRRIPSYERRFLSKPGGKAPDKSEPADSNTPESATDREQLEILRSLGYIQ